MATTRVWLSPKEAADLLGVTVETLHVYRRAGKVKAWAINSRVFRFHLDELTKAKGRPEVAANG